MVTNRKATGRAMSMGGGIALGTGLSLLVTLIGAMLVAWLIANEKLPEASVGYGSMVILLCASVTGAWLAAAKIKHRKLLVCILTGAGYYLSLLSITALLFGGQYQGMGVTGMMILCGCGIVILSGLKPPKSRLRGLRKTGYR